MSAEDLEKSAYSLLTMHQRQVAPRVEYQDKVKKDGLSFILSGESQSSSKQEMFKDGNTVGSTEGKVVPGEIQPKVGEIQPKVEPSMPLVGESKLKVLGESKPKVLGESKPKVLGESKPKVPGEAAKSKGKDGEKSSGKVKKPKKDMKGTRKESKMGYYQHAVTKHAFDETLEKELEETDIPELFKIQDEHNPDLIRLLCDFYFCTPDGKPVNLDVLEKPAEEQPHIMGFGTVVEPYSQEEHAKLIESLLVPLPAPVAKKIKPGVKKKKLNTGKGVVTQSPEKKTDASGKAPSTMVKEGALDSTNKGSVKEEQKDAANVGTSSVPQGAVKGDASNGNVDSPTKMEVDERKDKESSAQSSPLKSDPGKSTAKPAAKKPVVKSVTKPKKKGKTVKLSPDELDVLESGFVYPETKKRIRIRMLKILDWCLDYSVEDPTLWVITGHGWYKVAGPLSGVFPQQSYRPYFDPIRRRFEACFRVAHILREFLPRKRRLSYAMTLNGILTHSAVGRHALDEEFLMDNYHFIVKQIRELDQDDDSRLSSMFFKNLLRLKTLRDNKLAKIRAHKAGVEERRLERLEVRKQEKAEVQRLDALEKTRRSEVRKFPMEDLALLQSRAIRGEKITLRPPPECQSLAPPSVMGHITMAWQMLAAFVPSLPLISLEAITAALCSNTSPCVLVNDVFVSLIVPILEHKSYEVVRSYPSTEFYRHGRKPSSTCLSMDVDLTSAINKGTWQEVLRRIMEVDCNIVSKAYNPLPDCEIILHALYMQTSAVPFLEPVDATTQDLSDYNEKIVQPMDLGTVLDKFSQRKYKNHEDFAKDVRLIWSNAIYYNDKHSELTKAARSLSELFEFEFKRRVLVNVKSSMQALTARNLLESELRNLSAINPSHSRPCVTINRAVLLLGMMDFWTMPVEYKAFCLSWVCTQFNALPQVAEVLEQHGDEECENARLMKKQEKEDEFSDGQAEREYREALKAVRADAKLKKLDFDAESKIQNSSIQLQLASIEKKRIEAEVAMYAKDREREELLRMGPRTTQLRLLPVGLDRYFDRYWFLVDSMGSYFFIEEAKTGNFVMYQSEISNVMDWLHPQGLRESALLKSLTKLRCKLDRDLSKGSAQRFKNYTLFRGIGNPKDPVNCFLTKEGDFNGVFYRNLECSSTYQLDPVEVAKACIMGIESFVCREGVAESSWLEVEQQNWRTKVSSMTACSDFVKALLELESVIVKHCSGVVWHTWKAAYQDWVFECEQTYTWAKLLICFQYFMDKCIRLDAMTDLANTLDRKAWLNLRPKSARVALPAVGDRAIYFGEGHLEAIVADNAKQFVWEGDSPLPGTHEFEVHHISYHEGGDQPYARLTLHSMQDSKVKRLNEGECLCPEAPELLKLSRLFSVILDEVSADAEAGPFLEQVVKKDFPDYFEMVSDPMALSTMQEKNENLCYLSEDEFKADMTLIKTNCSLFCEDRYPDLPPMATQLEERCFELLKRHAVELQACSKSSSISAMFPIANSPDIDAETELTVVVRLDKKFPHYLVSRKHYENWINSKYEPGQAMKLIGDMEENDAILMASKSIPSGGLISWKSLIVSGSAGFSALEYLNINPWDATIVNQREEKARPKRP